MSKLIFYETRFKCNECDVIKDIYVWSNRQEDPCCEICTAVMDEIDKYSNESFTILNPEHKKGRSKKEQWDRKSKNFRQEILPTLTGKDRRYFEKKFGKPL